VAFFQHQAPQFQFFSATCKVPYHLGGLMRLAFIVLTLCSIPAWGQSPTDIYRRFPVLQCPKIGEEFEKMIAKLESVKSSIRKEANCKNVELQVESLEKLVVTDRQEVMDIISGQSGDTLSADQAKKVRNYAENVTKKVAALNDLFMRTNQCFDRDSADKQLSTLSGFVSEASGLIGSLAGPWGAPIAMAGNVVAGFLTGLDQVLKSRAGYDFSKPEQWSGYVQNLCTYHSFRDQIDHLLNPKAKITQMKDLKLKLDLQIRLLTSNCGECRSIEQLFGNAGTNLPAETMNQMQADVRNADNRFGQPFGSYTLQSLGLREWTIKEISRIEKEAQTYWSDVSGRNLLYRTKEDLEKFLLEKEAPRFLAFQSAQARNDYSNFTAFLAQEGRTIYTRVEGINRTVLSRKIDYPGWTDPLEFLRSLVIHAPNFATLPNSEAIDDAKFSLDYFRSQSLLRLQTAKTSAAVVQSFCSFFKHSGRYSPSIRGNCISSNLRTLIAEQDSIDSELAKAKVIPENPGSPTIDPDFSNSIPYSMNRVESMIRAIELRSQANKLE
jgi:hypothetical protein